MPKQDHLVCFIGGYLMLGSASERLYDKTSSREEDETMYTFNIGQAITKSCVETYTQSKTGLGAEIVHYFDERLIPAMVNDISGRAWFINRAKWVHQQRHLACNLADRRYSTESPFSTTLSDEPPHDAKYMLRPETVESLFVGWRLTHDPIYRYAPCACVVISGADHAMQALGMADLPGHPAALQGRNWRVRHRPRRRRSASNARRPYGDLLPGR